MTYTRHQFYVVDGSIAFEHTVHHHTSAARSCTISYNTQRHTYAVHMAAKCMTFFLYTIFSLSFSIFRSVFRSSFPSDPDSRVGYKSTRKCSIAQKIDSKIKKRCTDRTIAAQSNDGGGGGPVTQPKASIRLVYFANLSMRRNEFHTEKLDVTAIQTEAAL